MIDPAFSSPGSFFRGNLHTHSDKSDGKLAPQEVCRRYRDEGYDFISLTDHFVGSYNYPITDTTGFRDNRFTTILGAELHSGAMQNGELWHLLAVGLPSDFAPSNSPAFVPVDNQETGAELARRARDAGAFVAIAHPEWSGLTMSDARTIEAAHAVEIYNYGCDVECDRGRGFHTLDLLLSEGRKLNLCATDDAHFHGPDHFGGWVMVKAEANHPDLLLEALKAGHFYSSQGPTIQKVEWSAKHVDVECSAAKAIIVQGYGSAATVIYGDSMTRGSVKLGRLSKSEWMRVTVVDAAGKKAWTNPVWRKDIA
ncbi:MAG: CehA/McbA family metallohydrolase [Pseudomonadota bacterium]